MKERLLRIAKAVSDGEDVDWRREEESSGESAERGLVRSLKLVGLVSRLQSVDAEAGREGRARGRGDDSLGELKILEPVGRGSYGDVYRAWDARLEREVALKILRERPTRETEATSPNVERASDSEAERLLREARRLASVRHTNVVTIHAAEMIDGRQAIRMEYVQGRTLAEIAAQQGPFGGDEIANIGTHLCRALAAVHAAGLVHRDVKAQNVMREQGGRIVLMDFGAGGATPVYSAPELLAGESATVSSDLYSLGVLLFFLATGSFPVVGESLAELRAAHARAARSRLRDLRPDLAPAIVRAIDRALAADPRERFATAGEMEAALAVGASTSSGGAASWTGVAGESERPRSRRRIARAAALVVAGAALAALAIWTLRPTDRSQHGATESATRITSHEPAHAIEGFAASRAAPTPTTTAPFTVEARFYRGRQQREPLADGARVALGDSISLAIEASESVHVYVIDQDDRGEAFLLFPLRGMEPRNPLAPSVLHVLPGMREGRRYYWRVTSTGGREHIVTIASRDRLVDFEAEMLLIDRPLEGREPEYARVPSSAKEKLRGLGGLASETTPVPGGPAEDLFAAAAPLGAGPQSAQRVWVGRVDLENPPPEN